MADDELHPTLFDLEPTDRVEPAEPAAPVEPAAAPTVPNEPAAHEGRPFSVEVVRSARRKRTVGAELRGDVLRVTVPSWMSRADEAAWVDKMSASFRRKRSAERIDLGERANTLARRHQLPRPRDIRWADDMTTRWGSCTYGTASIRISTRLAPFPDWVIDYVIVHELCHLEVRGHGADFWKLAHRYPKAERAIGFLIAKSGDDLDEE
jgi:predicted metal-dependent hydrolase